MHARHVIGLALAVAGVATARAQSRSDLPEPVMARPEPVAVLGPPAPEASPAAGRTPLPSTPSLPEDTPAEQVARPPEQPVTSLVEALARAYWTNPQLLAQRAQVRATDYRVPQARSAYGPEIRYSASRGYAYDQTDLVPGTALTRSGWTTTASAVIDQPLFTFGRLRAAEDSARSQVDFQRGSLASREQDTMLQTIGAYVAVIRERNAVGIAESQVDLLTRQFNDIAIRLEARDSTSADLQQIQSRLELARAQLQNLAGSQASSAALFLQIVGAPPGELAAPNPLVIPVRSIEDAYLYAEERNPVIRAAYARERTSRAELAAAKAERYPRIDLRGTATRDPVTPYTNALRQNELRAAVTVSGAIDSGARQARVDELRAANDADWRLIDDVLRQNRQEIADAWNAWKTQGAAVESLVVATDAAEKAYLGGREQQRASFRTTTELLDLARDVLTARSTLNSARANVIIAQARLLAAMGALDYASLLPDAPVYDPAAHLERVEHDADFPLVVPAIRALDGVASRPARDRPLRDPAAPLATGEAALDHP